MTTQNIALMEALGKKMSYLNQRQRILSQNIANADTPGYRPKDLTPVDFSSILKNISGAGGTGGVQPVHLATTDAMHIGTPGGGVSGGEAKAQKTTYEVAPAGNAVILEEQMVNAGQTMIDYNFTTSLYEHNVRMIKTALGTAQ